MEKSYTHHEALQALLAIGDAQRSRERGGSDECPQVYEEDHIDADRILFGLIGSDEIRQAFERIAKWYA